MNHAYLWMLTLHLWGVLMWTGGLLAALLTLSQPATARALLRRLAHPGAALAVIGGAGLVGLHPQWLAAGWLHAKLLLVVALIALDLLLAVRVAGGRAAPAWIPPLVVLLVFAIVALAAVKPF